MILRLALVLMLAAPSAAADEIRCAVAANFLGCFEEVAAAFEDATGHQVTVSPGSTGAQYAQIRQGAPFHLFFAADAERPRRLEQEGLAVSGSRATYAVGSLVLWIRNHAPTDNPDLATALEHPGLERLAVADARLAPYGQATRSVLDALGVRHDDRLVTGRSVGQAWQFVASGAADAGFVARAQIPADGPPDGILVAVPARLHDPIRQQVVLLQESPAAAAELLGFILAGPGRDIVAACGYATEAGE